MFWGIFFLLVDAAAFDADGVYEQSDEAHRHLRLGPFGVDGGARGGL